MREFCQKNLTLENFEVAASLSCALLFAEKQVIKRNSTETFTAKQSIFQTTGWSVFDLTAWVNENKKVISPPSDLLKKLATKISQSFDSHSKTPVTFQSQRQ